MGTTSKGQQDAKERLIQVLSDAAVEIRRLEVNARALLYEQGDQQGYRDHLRLKAIVLSELTEKMPRPDELPPHLNALCQERVGGFSFEADRALRLDSVFYMAVLLYPEDYQEGAANELENFISSLLTC